MVDRAEAVGDPVLPAMADQQDVGVGEIGLVPTAGAVAGALEAFDGIRRTRLPMKDSPVARAINVGRIPQAGRDDWH